MFTFCQTKEMLIRFKGDTKFLPKDIIMDEVYPVIGISHDESHKTIVKDKKERNITRHSFVLFIISETGNIVSIPDYNCTIILEDNAPKK